MCYREKEQGPHQPYELRAVSANLSLHTWQGKEHGEKQDWGLFAKKHFHQSENCQGCEY